MDHLADVLQRATRRCNLRCGRIAWEMGISVTFDYDYDGSRAYGYIQLRIDRAALFLIDMRFPQQHPTVIPLTDQLIVHRVREWANSL
jgi:hypothetical protein